MYRLFSYYMAGYHGGQLPIRQTEAVPRWHQVVLDPDAPYAFGYKGDM